jgi:Holliday junction resolvase RusA-like endonuclease
MKLRDFFKDLTPAKIAERDAKIKRDRERYEDRSVRSTIESITTEDLVHLFNPQAEDLHHPLTPKDFEDITKPEDVLGTYFSNLLSCDREEKKFVINICPMGAPRMNRSVRWKPNKAQIRYFAFKDALRAAVGSPPVPDELIVTAHLPICNSWSKKRRAEMVGKPHRIRPDWDNISKGICDALFGQDCGIWSGSCKKFWCQQGQERLELTLVYYYKKKGCAQSGS